MRFAPLVTVTSAALGGATAAPEEHQEEARADFLGIVFGQSNFRGGYKEIFDGDSGRCIDLRKDLHDGVQSIQIDRQDRDTCFLYDLGDCRGNSRRFDRDERDISPRNWISVRCFSGRH